MKYVKFKDIDTKLKATIHSNCEKNKCEVPIKDDSTVFFIRTFNHVLELKYRYFQSYAYDNNCLPDIVVKAPYDEATRYIINIFECGLIYKHESEHKCKKDGRATCLHCNFIYNLIKPNINKSTIHLVITRKYLNQCETCGKSGTAVNLKVCSRCKTINYCSKECQTKDWKSHRELCKSIIAMDKKSKSKSTK